MRRARVNHEEINTEIVLKKLEHSWKVIYQSTDNNKVCANFKERKDAEEHIIKILKERQDFSVLTNEGVKYPLKNKPNNVRIENERFSL